MFFGVGYYFSLVIVMFDKIIIKFVFQVKWLISLLYFDANMQNKICIAIEVAQLPHAFYQFKAFF